MPNATVRPNTAEHPPQPALTSDEVQAPAADFAPPVRSTPFLLSSLKRALHGIG